MGLTYSTENYEKIMNVIEKPYLDGYKNININLHDVVNIDNDNRAIVYKHKTKDIYLLYVGGICNVCQCFEVNENSLLRYSNQFGSFYALKEYIIKNYSQTELLLELVKYESKNYIDIIDNLDALEKGSYENIINFEFTDSEDSDDSYVEVKKQPEEWDINNYNWGDNWDLDWAFNVEEINKFSKNHTAKTINAANNAVRIAKEATYYANNVVEDTVNYLEKLRAVDLAVVISNNASDYSVNLVNNINEVVHNINTYLYEIPEELPYNEFDDSDDDDIIYPNLNYFNSLRK